MKMDRMAAFEAPRERDAPKRPSSTVALRFRGGGKSVDVQIPRDMPRPEMVIYKGRYFIKRDDKSYGEATSWPIIKDLDA